MNPDVRVENLAAVPSYHFEPVFAREVRRAFDEFRPTAVALEMPAFLEGELDWAVSCWPTPVASEASYLYPFVPGDSMVEAFRLARERRIDVHLVDLAVAEKIERSSIHLPGPEFAPRVGALFLQALDAVLAAGGPRAEGDLAREAHMAGRLAELMRDHERVLWVGGAAHWPALRRRLIQHDLAAPLVSTCSDSAFVRVRLAGAALLRLTDRLPHLVSLYAAAPDLYEEAEALQSLALEAVAPEAIPARDVSRVLVYARNLVASSELRERPSWWELSIAASAVISDAYAVRLLRLAIREEISKQARDLPVLTYERALVAKAWPPGAVGRRRMVTPFPSEEELRRREGDRPYAGLPEGSGETWHDVLPTDRLDYEAFVQVVLRSATSLVSGDGEARPFQSGLRDGIDVRATLRHWHEEGELYVREPSREEVPITNAVIDFQGAGESSAFLRGEPPVAADPSQRMFWPADASTGVVMPWTESSRLRVGSISRMCRVNETLQQRPLVQRLHRGLSFVSLDRANGDGVGRADGKPANGFESQVIIPLLELAFEPDRDRLENWLRVFFRFARGKPVAYFSRYVPGVQIHAVARQCGVRVQHVPLDRIPAGLRERHQTFRIAEQNDGQWDVLRQRIAERKGARGLPPATPPGSTGGAGVMR